MGGKHDFFEVRLRVRHVVSIIVTADAHSELHVLLHKGHTIGMNSAQVGIREDADEVSFSSLLEGLESTGRVSDLRIEAASDLSDGSGERCSLNEELVVLLVGFDLADGNSARLPLSSDAALSWSILARGVVGEDAISFPLALDLSKIGALGAALHLARHLSLLGNSLCASHDVL